MKTTLRITIEELKRGDLGDVAGMGIILPDWVDEKIPDPFVLKFLIYLIKKEYEAISIYKTNEIIKSPIELYEESGIGKTKVREIIEFLVSANVIIYKSPADTKTKKSVIIINEIIKWFEQGNG